MFRSPCSKFVLAAMLAMALSSGFARAEEKQGDAVIPVFKLTGALSEAGSEDSFSFSGEQPGTLRDLVAKLKQAGEKVKDAFKT